MSTGKEHGVHLVVGADDTGHGFQYPFLDEPFQLVGFGRFLGQLLIELFGLDLRAFLLYFDDLDSSRVQDSSGVVVHFAARSLDVEDVPLAEFGIFVEHGHDRALKVSDKLGGDDRSDRFTAVEGMLLGYYSVEGSSRPVVG